jgi:hypothetical protein
MECGPLPTTTAPINISFEILLAAFSSGGGEDTKKLKDIKGMLTSYRAIDGLALGVNQRTGRGLTR